MKKNFFITIVLVYLAYISYGQQENSSIRSGNKFYKQSEFDRSLAEYKKAVSAAPANPLANYNLGNAEFRTNQLAEAVSSYEASIQNSAEKPVKEKAFYNKGVAFSKQQNLKESIDAWKNALKLDPNDQEARENLQKALVEQKKQQEKEDQQKNEKDKKNDKKKQDKEQQQQQDKQQPQQPQSRLSKKQVEQLLKALAQKEKEVQQKMQSKNSSPSRQDKDW